jgi:hypothetical protein
LNYDIDTRDWQGNYTIAESIYQSILSQHSPASSAWISLEHDIYSTTVHVFAQYIIDTARKLGYQLVTVGECLGDAPSNWYRNATTGQPASPVAGGVKNVGGSQTSQTSQTTTRTSVTTSRTTTGSKTTSPTTTTHGSFPSAIAVNNGNGNGNGNGSSATKTSTTTTAAATTAPTATKSDSLRLYTQGGSVVLFAMLVLAFIL